MRLAIALAAVIAATLVAGCGSSSEQESTRIETAPREDSSGGPIGAAAKSCETDAVDAVDLRATGISCARARQVMYGWQQKSSCSTPAGASRVACSSRSYRCTGTRTDRGTAVSCSRPGRSVAFVVRSR